MLRLPPERSDRDSLKAGCFRLIPFDNRLEGNRLLVEANFTTQAVLVPGVIGLQTAPLSLKFQGEH
ncbi:MULTISPECIES: hypothetical protein [unclassified Mesorhizobium]|uniref:hypothetical protein n=1 Tax=unclassified Mesorhizobium TaxID=325217 RepID=UPI00112E6086|nr:MULTISPECIES: hypothetical protein [unclassified Mesorhizobium]TPJ31497.1 hypothetical protein FJ425_00805 [Mesorhizobium sp. B2-7-2]TPO10482.1 hypothetical protein FJ980_08090 [Mesorhizobium sp. B1-1-5]